MKKLTLLILTLILTSCATQFAPKTTPPLHTLYTEPNLFHFYGYKDWRKGSNGFDIKYTGIQRHSIEVALDFALLRASELCINKDLPYFGLTSVSTYKKRYSFEKHSSPLVKLHVNCYATKISDGIYDANFVWNEVNQKIRSNGEGKYISLIKRKPKS